LQRLADYASLAWECAHLQEALDKAGRARSEFVDFVAHELKQPMTSIQGYAKMLHLGMGGDLSESQRQFVEVIASSVDRMGNLIDNLLEISRLEDGRAELDLGTLQLEAVVEEVVAATRAEIEARSHRLIVDVPEELPAAQGDTGRLVQILMQLVRNAYQYTPEGGTITIAIDGPEEVEIPGGQLLVSVSDTGIGMPAEELDRLGEMFFRGGHELVRSQPGTGLGLAITRQLVALHGGDLLVESEPGRGSTFAFTVPKER
jgi:signal transduction histidine kinase